MVRRALALAAVAALLGATPCAAQRDSVLDAIWREGMQGSRVEPLAQALLDSIGPRLTGTPGEAAARAWVLARYREWGVGARDEKYGTWTGWRRGATRVELVSPRARSLQAAMLAWSPGTEAPVRAPVVVLPRAASPAEFSAWLATAAGKFVLVSPPEPTCRPDDGWARWAEPATLERMRRERAEAAAAWEARVAATGVGERWLPIRLEGAGVAGVLASHWSGGWGASHLHNTWTLRVPMLELSCEDYGLAYRLAENGQAPEIRVSADAQFLGDVPVSNTVAEIRGAVPGEYVVLSAHLDSWDGAAGATDNGSGTVAVMEAMRILRRVYPRPRRTLLAGHWGGEEQGLNGSLSFAADHPEVVRGIHALFNLDQGTGRVAAVSAGGAPRAAERLRRWLASVPGADSVVVATPDSTERDGSDHVSFACRGAPAYNLLSRGWDYRPYTWHTDRDSFDKLVIDEVRANAVLLAMLAYLAAEDGEPLAVAAPPAGAPACRVPARSMVEFLERLMQ
jgi:hypothetical protein